MSPTADGAGIWKQIQGRLRQELPAATYSTWVAQAEAISLRDGLLTIAVGNSWARDRLAEIGPLERVTRELLGDQAGVAVVIPGDLDSDSAALPADAPPDVTLQTVYRSAYDEVVRPEQAIPLPHYYLRWLPYLGVDLAWIPVGFRQVAFFRGLGFEAGDCFRASLREIALWSGMSVSSLKRKVDDPRLGWFVRRADREPLWRVGPDGKPHREALDWQVEASMPMTPADQTSLDAFLRQRLADGLTAAQAIQAAYQMPLDDLLPWPDPADLPEMADKPRSVQEVVQRALGKAGEFAGLRQAIDALAFHVAGYADPVYVGHHFLRHALPTLGGGPGWFVQWLRASAADQGNHGQVLIPGGYPRIAAALGVATRTVKRWMADVDTPGSDLSRFVLDPRSIKHGDGSVDLLLEVHREDPLDQVAHQPEGHSGLYGADPEGRIEPNSRPPEGRSEPHSRQPEGQIGMIRAAAGGHSEPHSTTPAGQVEPNRIEWKKGPEGHAGPHSHPGQRDRLTPFKGGGGESLSSGETGLSSTSLHGSRLSSDGQAAPNSHDEWDLARLLGLAGVHPANRQLLSQASPVAWVSWLLYWASTLGQRLVEPTGNAVSRLKEAPMAPMTGAFERLAALGPNGLEELIVPRVLSRYGNHPSNRDWEDVMSGAPEDRLRRLVDLLGFDVAAWREDEEDGGDGKLDG